MYFLTSCITIACAFHAPSFHHNRKLSTRLYSNAPCSHSPPWRTFYKPSLTEARFLAITCAPYDAFNRTFCACPSHTCFKSHTGLLHACGHVLAAWKCPMKGMRMNTCMFISNQIEC